MQSLERLGKTCSFFCCRLETQIDDKHSGKIFNMANEENLAPTKLLINVGMAFLPSAKYYDLFCTISLQTGKKKNSKNFPDFK